MSDAVPPSGQPSGPRSVSVVLPVYRQADHIGLVVEEYLQALARVPVPTQLLLAPNGPRDETHAACAELARRHAGVELVDCPRAGWGAAVRAGLAAATGDLLCYTNSARTAPEDLVLLLLYALAYPEVVVKANRKVREGRLRRLGSLAYNLECRALFDLSQWDLNGTPKVFSRAAHPALLELEREDDLIDLEFNVRCRREGYRMIEVPLFSSRRHGGKSTTNWRTALRLYSGALRLRQGEP
ncbi:MAG: glycosyltransferase family 2 protein [Planctomycetota bacterium]